MFFRTGMTRSALVLAAIGIGLAPLPVQAQAPFTVNSVRVVGTGCPKGTFSTVTLNDPAVQALSVLFSAFTATGEPPKVMPNGRDRVDAVVKRCNIIADITPRPGVQVALINVQASGNAVVFGGRDTDMGENNVVRIERRYFFATQANDKDEANPRGEFLGTKDLPPTTRIVDSSSSYSIGEETSAVVGFAGCNAPVRARIQLTLAVTGDGNYGDIGALDQDSTIQFAFRAKPCTGSEPKREPVLRAPAATRRSRVLNACVLEGGDTGRLLAARQAPGPRFKVCYDSTGKELSREADPNL
jgi:hypothetical protein